ncbi:hypothetical protein DVK85_00950 [Flavobacterium arcticum]|uniref:Uncharacterized protein n=1 Tax=Flavobacterium arcticum TaxID=1784713 RepID=A0A345H8G3_9FLAO|nr:hypothetical protein [Flavobacterium arcticum]AXG72873.1 hypothetical protein DVK85_00950 [Flavobacterium arcticum]KAF2510463.1 hypothetical protein E0W72_08255 [Flavobacterium arcticum]
MRKKLYITFFLVGCCVLLLSFINKREKNNVTTFSLLTQQKTYKAGSPIMLTFKSSSNVVTSLLLKSSYGSVLLNATKSNDTLNYIVPKFYIQKAGYISWVLIGNDKHIHKGNFDIIPEDDIRIENYLGPRSMPAGDGHYTMMVSIPTDRYDNPKPDDTPTIIKTQFLENITEQSIPTKDFISWKRIYSPEKAGKIITSVACMGKETKETETDVYATIPTNFTIDYTRNHAFSDGNQATTLTSSIIKDKFGNTVGDGTMVTYIATTTENAVLKTYGNTVQGIAQADILSPEHADVYTVKAYINGMAESNTVNIKYKQVKTSIDYTLSDDKRTVTVGAINSFMNQIAPDGTTVTLQVYHKGKLVDSSNEYTRKGMAAFTLSEEVYKEKEYSFAITALGNTVTTEIIHYNAGK